MDVSIVREPDDKIAKTRVSLGTPKDFDGMYIVFRGEPEDVIELLKHAYNIAMAALPIGRYQDHRGRPQG